MRSAPASILLGGGLAYLGSDMYGLEADGFDPSPMRDVGYCYMWEEMSKEFRGTDAWKAMDYSNELVRLVGLMENKWRDAYFVKNVFTDILDLPEGGDEAYRPHARESIFTFDKSSNTFRLSEVVWQVGKGNMQNNWLKEKTVNTLIEEPISGFTILPLGSRKLGTTGANTLQGNAFVHTEVLYGGNGNDTLVGHQGDDVLVGGRGRDDLDGGSYDDKYVYQKGDGRTVIWDVSGKDILYLYGFTNEDNVTFEEGANAYSILLDGEIIIEIKKSRDVKRSNFSSFKVEGGGKTRTLDNWVSRIVNAISAFFPVDMEVYDASGNLVTTLEDGTETVLHEDYGNFYVVQGEKTGEYGKLATLFNEEGHTIKLVGTGMMQYSVEDTDDAGNQVLYYANDMPITPTTVITTSPDGCTLYADSDGNGSTDSEVACTTTGGINTPVTPGDNTEKYTVTIQNDGNGTANASAASAAQGTTITLTATANTGYQFKQWQVIAGGVTVTNNSFTMPAGAVTVKAIFEGIPVIPGTTYYTVKFDPKFGTRTGGGELTQTIPSGGAATAPIVTRSGFTFQGWDQAFANVTSNLTVNALWTESTGSTGGNDDSDDSGNSGGSSVGGSRSSAISSAPATT